MNELLEHLSEILLALDAELERAETEGSKHPEQIAKYRKRIDRWKTECFGIVEAITGKHPITASYETARPEVAEAIDRLSGFVQMFNPATTQKFVAALDRASRIPGLSPNTKNQTGASK